MPPRSYITRKYFDAGVLLNLLFLGEVNFDQILLWDLNTLFQDLKPTIVRDVIEKHDVLSRLIA